MRTPLPDECFQIYRPSSDLGESGPLTLERVDDWIQALVQVVQSYVVQTTRCAELNKQRK